MDNLSEKMDYYLGSTIPHKIMTIMIVKNVCHGLYLGITDFKSSDKPVTQLVDKTISYTAWGFIEALFWPFTFTFMITTELDNFAKYLMNK